MHGLVVNFSISRQPAAYGFVGLGMAGHSASARCSSWDLTFSARHRPRDPGSVSKEIRLSTRR